MLISPLFGRDDYLARVWILWVSSIILVSSISNVSRISNEKGDAEFIDEFLLGFILWNV